MCPYREEYKCRHPGDSPHIYQSLCGGKFERDWRIKRTFRLFVCALLCLTHTPFTLKHTIFFRDGHILPRVWMAFHLFHNFIPSPFGAKIPIFYFGIQFTYILSPDVWYMVDVSALIHDDFLTQKRLSWFRLAYSKRVARQTYWVHLARSPSTKRDVEIYTPEVFTKYTLLELKKWP